MNNTVLSQVKVVNEESDVLRFKMFKVLVEYPDWSLKVRPYIDAQEMMFALQPEMVYLVRAWYYIGQEGETPNYDNILKMCSHVVDEDEQEVLEDCYFVVEIVKSLTIQPEDVEILKAVILRDSVFYYTAKLWNKIGNLLESIRFTDIEAWKQMVKFPNEIEPIVEKLKERTVILQDSIELKTNNGSITDTLK